MKHKLKVYYTVQYVKEVELDLNDKNLEIVKNGNCDCSYNVNNNCYEDIYSNNQDILEDLPIPNIENLYNGWSEKVDYVEDSFQIDYFTL